MCRSLYLIPEIFYGASVWYITVIAIDRYLKVVTVKNIRHKVNTSLQRARAVAVLLQFCVALTFTFSLGVIKDKAPFNWPFGEFVCRYLYLIPEIFYGASVWYITVIAIDRYLKVVTVKNIRHKVNTSLQRARAVAVLLQFSVALTFTFSLGVFKDKAPFNWSFGEFACRYLYLIPEIFYGVSVWYITVIAIDKCLKVVTVKNIQHKVNTSLQRARAIAVLLQFSVALTFTFSLGVFKDKAPFNCPFG